MMKRAVAIAVVALVGAGAIGGFVVAATGVVPIRASAGHWGATEWFLQFSKRRSVALRALGREGPRLDAAWEVRKGAGHYESGCKPCHGSPDAAVPIFARAMLPPAPELSSRVGLWEPVELAEIVHHGLKFTGMPAWPSQVRVDEVDAVVAFLLELPSMDATHYRRLVFGESGSDQAPSTPSVAASCVRCHGSDGCAGPDAAFPRLAGQRRDYLVNALSAYAAGERHSGVMLPFAAVLQPDELHELADHYSGLPACVGAPAGDPAAVARGRAVAEKGAADRRVPACRDCHDPDGDAHNPAIPSLTAQHSDYLLLQLELFSRGTRGGSEYAHLMDTVVSGLERAEMVDIAAYYGATSSSGDAPTSPALGSQ